MTQTWSSPLGLVGFTSSKINFSIRSLKANGEGPCFSGSYSFCSAFLALDISNARKALQKLYDPEKHGPSPLAFNDLIEKFIFELVNPTNPNGEDHV